MTAEQNDSIAYEIAMLVKENRELHSQNIELERRVKELDEYNDELLQEIDGLKRAQAKENCESDIKAGDKVVIHTKCKSSLFCDGFVLTANDSPRENYEGYMMLPCCLVNSDGSPRTGTGSIHSFKSRNYSWEKVDPDTPVTTFLKVGLKGTEHYNYRNELEWYSKYTAHYTNLYGGKSDSKIIIGCLYVEKSNE